MNRIIFQVVLVVVSVALFFSFVDPLYSSQDESNPGITKLKEEIKKYNEANTQAEELIKKITALSETRADIDLNSRNRLEGMLPDSIDNIRLIIDINNIAVPYGLVLKSLQLTGIDDKSKKGATTDNSTPNVAIGGNDVIGSVTISFSVSAKYETFKLFMHDLEKSLRLVDVTDLSLKSNTKDYYDFAVTLKTYWLR